MWRVRVAVKAMYLWACSQGWLGKGAESPIEKLHNGKLTSKKAIVSDEDFEKVLKEARKAPRLKELMIFIRYTGCRPFEIIQSTAANIDWSIPAIRHRFEDTKQEQKDRMIILNDKVKEIIERRAKRGGLLFKSRNGEEKEINIRNAGASVKRLSGLRG
jgi:integrase